MNLSSINTLLEVVKLIDLKYQEISKLTGRKYNVFDILGVSTDEVRLHSSFIAQLLNPFGSHGQKDIYLNLFLHILEERIKSSEGYPKMPIGLDTNSARVDVEVYIGRQTNDEGGRLDIKIDLDNHSVIIENKIYAADQPNQLLRYHNYSHEATIIYLTLFGTEPSKESLGGKDFRTMNVVLLSYESDIVRWLELCLKESYQLPAIRETILQYLNTIKRITNQIEIREMDNEIVKLLTNNSDKILSAILIEKSIKDAKKLLIKRFGAELKTSLEITYSKKAIVNIDENFGEQYKGITVTPNNTAGIYFQISFLREFNSFYLEIFNADNFERKPKDEQTLEFYRDRLGNECKPLGKIENVRSAWHGDWVCRYEKLDKYFSLDSSWGELAEKKYEIVGVVMNEISPVIDAMLERVG